MSDVLAQVDVLAKDSGCLVDITAVMDQGLCSKVMVKTDVPYETEDHPDYVSIIPTKSEGSGPGYEAPLPAQNEPHHETPAGQIYVSSEQEEYPQPPKDAEYSAPPKHEEDYFPPEDDYTEPPRHDSYPTPPVNGDHTEPPQHDGYPTPPMEEHDPEPPSHNQGYPVPREEYPSTAGGHGYRDEHYNTPSSPNSPQTSRPGNPFEVSEQVCEKPTVALDLDLLVILGLLTEKELEDYLRILGNLDDKEELDVDGSGLTIDDLLGLIPGLGNGNNGGNFPGGGNGGNFPGGNQPGGNFPGGNFPGGNQPGGNFPGGNQPGGNFPGGNLPGGNPGGLIPSGLLPTGALPTGPFPGGNNGGMTSVPGGNTGFITATRTATNDGTLSTSTATTTTSTNLTPTNYRRPGLLNLNVGEPDRLVHLDINGEDEEGLLDLNVNDDQSLANLDLNGNPLLDVGPRRGNSKRQSSERPGLLNLNAGEPDRLVHLDINGEEEEGILDLNLNDNDSLLNIALNGNPFLELGPRRGNAKRQSFEHPSSGSSSSGSSSSESSSSQRPGLLNLNVGEPDRLVHLDVNGEDEEGILDLDVNNDDFLAELNLNGNPFLNLGPRPSNSKRQFSEHPSSGSSSSDSPSSESSSFQRPGLLNLNVGEPDRLVHLDVNGEDEQGILDLDVNNDDFLAELNLNGNPFLNLGPRPSNSKRQSSDRPGLLNLNVDQEDRLLHLDLNGEEDGLLNLNVNDDEALLTLDLNGNPLLVLGPRPNRNSNSKRQESAREHLMSHYQPLCGRGFKPERLQMATSTHADDVNQCLAQCHAHAARATISAGAHTGETQRIQVCAAIEFNQARQADNCHFFTGPESQPCHDDELMDSEDSYTFFRN
ncbi:hypothetical protein S40285_08115 [Stachybotrys chlorohalonatus IBT 40285]|uniref:Uncharacterized protein n=1 Tax=Stachybotrys chlorohalonatus (strain IBT 40285) TaxID=1283841 RepID=A0A084R0J7_STAC4|nr:hypothetical protein S40285_08115 [Stachybotrys chlorohalonata IBT 40285]